MPSCPPYAGRGVRGAQPLAHSLTLCPAHSPALGTVSRPPVRTFPPVSPVHLSTFRPRAPPGRGAGSRGPIFALTGRRSDAMLGAGRTLRPRRASPRARQVRGPGADPPRPARRGRGALAARVAGAGPQGPLRPVGRPGPGPARGGHGRPGGGGGRPGVVLDGGGAGGAHRVGCLPPVPPSAPLPPSSPPHTHPPHAHRARAAARRLADSPGPLVLASHPRADTGGRGRRGTPGVPGGAALWPRPSRPCTDTGGPGTSGSGRGVAPQPRRPALPPPSPPLSRSHRRAAAPGRDAATGPPGPGCCRGADSEARGWWWWWGAARRYSPLKMRSDRSSVVFNMMVRGRWPAVLLSPAADSRGSPPPSSAE